MKIELCKSKIHKARLTQCDLHYEGSLTIDSEIVAAAGMHAYEKILVVNATNGERLETYIIPGEAGSKIFCLNGAAAHKGNVGDVVTIISFGIFDEPEVESFLPKIIILDCNNDIIARKGNAIIN